MTMHRRHTALPVRLALLSTTLAVLGCHLLDITNPDVVPIDLLGGPTALSTVRAGAIGDFTVAYSGSGASGSGGTIEGQIMVSGMLADEWINTETFPDRIQVDARQTDPTSATMAGVFADLSRARVSAENAVAQFRKFADTTTNAGLAELLTLGGLTYTMFAENYCSGVPFSNAQPDGSIQYGTPLTTQQMLDTAVSRFDQAILAATILDTSGATAAARAPKVNARRNAIAFARVAKARALLDGGRLADADTVASAGNVATGFVYVVQHDLNSSRQQNGVYNGDKKFKRYGVADKEGGNGLAWISVADPRTPVFRSPSTNKGFDNATPQFDQYRYIDEKASVTVATGAEARLINAEAALQRGDTAGFLGFLNALRAAPPSYFLVGDLTLQTQTIAPMAPLTSPASSSAAITLLFNERARWLWLTAHRLNDLRRLVRGVGVRGGYGLAVNSVFPTGAYFKNGLTYGNDVNLPVPVTEQNNPNFKQCLDRLP
jgi:starch-binding outer membrane protein, SusD/RagB family